MRQKKFLIILSFIFITILVVLVIINMRNVMKKNINPNGVCLPIFVNDYTYFRRDLYVKDFRSIRKGDKLEKIIKDIGPPNGTTGSGVPRNYYHLSDNSVMVICEDISGIYGIRHHNFWGEKWILSPE